jgi:hypothetical protein
MSVALVWMRRDLRVADNAALQAALAAGHQPVPVYIHAPHEEAPWAPGAATRWWLHHSLTALDGELRALGSSLLLRQGDSAAELDRLISETGAVACYWNRLYDPALTQRDSAIKQSLRARGLAAESFAGHLIAEPWEIRNGSGEPYRVFTPFWRTLKARLPLPEPLPAPRALPPHGVSGCALAKFDLLPRIDWDTGFHSAWAPGSDGARELLDRFVDAALENYATERDRPDRPRHLAPVAAPALRRDQPAPGLHQLRCAPSRQREHRALFARAGLARVRVTTCSTTSRTPRTSRCRPSSSGSRGRKPDPRRRSRPGSAAAPASRSSMPACASCGAPAGCTTACA